MEYVYLQPVGEIEIGGETNFAKLLKNDWCPLFGSFPCIETSTLGDKISQSKPTSRIVSVIFDARELLGVKPNQKPITETERKSFESAGIIPIPKYPKWKFNTVREIALTYPQVKNEADIICFENGRPLHTNTPLYENCESAIRIVREILARDSITPRSNDHIEDHHILAVLTIEEAWDVSKKIIEIARELLKVKNKLCLGNPEYNSKYNSKHDLEHTLEHNSDIMSQIYDAEQLLAQAKKMSLEDVINEIKPKAEYAEKELLKGNVFHRTGDYWNIVYGGENTSLKSTKGLTCIAHLLDNAGNSIRAYDLRMWVDKKVPTSGRDSTKDIIYYNEENRKEDESTSKHANATRDGVGVVLTSEAIAYINEELRELQEDLEIAKKNNDPGKKDKIQMDIDDLKNSLVADVGIKDHPREFNSNEEVDRKDIDTNIRRAYKKLKEKHNPLWLHLTNHIKISNKCSYSPDGSMDWDVKF